MASSTVRMSCSRGTCFSALSWRRAPMKSRLTSSRPPLSAVRRRKKTWGSPTLRGGLFRSADYTPDPVDRRPSLDRCRAAPAPSPPSGLWCPRPVSSLDVALQEADELVHQPVATERPIELAVDE